MKTIGQILKSARTGKKFSLKKIEEITKIKQSFVAAIEKEDWSKLPPFPIVLGFVKSISGALLIDEKMTVAILKRDYPPKTLTINPKKDVEGKQFWSPKVTFFLGIFSVILIVGGYILFQYLKFVSPPKLLVESPKENQMVTGNSILVFGTTDRDAKITVNNQPVLTDQDGKFSVDLGITQETKEVVVKAISRSGKETTISRTIKHG